MFVCDSLEAMVCPGECCPQFESLSFYSSICYTGLKLAIHSEVLFFKSDDDDPVVCFVFYFLKLLKV